MLSYKIVDAQYFTIAWLLTTESWFFRFFFLHLKRKYIFILCDTMVVFLMASWCYNIFGTSLLLSTRFLFSWTAKVYGLGEYGIQERKLNSSLVTLKIQVHCFRVWRDFSRKIKGLACRRRKYLRLNGGLYYSPGEIPKEKFFGAQMPRLIYLDY